MQTSSTISSATTASPASSAFAEFVLGQIRCARARAKITVNQMDMTITALSGGLILPEIALLILAETGIEMSS